MELAELRKSYHSDICRKILRITNLDTGKGYPNIADAGSEASKAISKALFKQLSCKEVQNNLSGQEAGDQFEVITMDFIQKAFDLLLHLRPGAWEYSTNLTAISIFDQFEHLGALEKLISKNKELRAALGSDYIVKPDIVISRRPVSDTEINESKEVIDDTPGVAQLTPFRRTNQATPRPILHASISCKWTMRSDRSQNTRTEALNLIRNRKGPLPHIVAVTAEPLPTRIAALALGTGDLDCVYHFALTELKQAVKEVENESQWEMLQTMIDGRRLRDISDLPFDLAI